MDTETELWQRESEASYSCDMPELAQYVTHTHTPEMKPCTSLVYDFFLPGDDAKIRNFHYNAKAVCRFFFFDNLRRFLSSFQICPCERERERVKNYVSGKSFFLLPSSHCFLHFSSFFFRARGTLSMLENETICYHTPSLLLLSKFSILL
jgi:hypothetical protein